MIIFNIPRFIFFVRLIIKKIMKCVLLRSHSRYNGLCCHEIGLPLLFCAPNRGRRSMLFHHSPCRNHSVTSKPVSASNRPSPLWLDVWPRRDGRILRIWRPGDETRQKLHFSKVPGLMSSGVAGDRCHTVRNDATCFPDRRRPGCKADAIAAGISTQTPSWSTARGAGL